MPLLKGIRKILLDRTGNVMSLGVGKFRKERVLQKLIYLKNKLEEMKKVNLLSNAYTTNTKKHHMC